VGQLESIKIFITVVETGSITKAADRLGLAKSAVSKRLAELELLLAVKLINRTTRSSSLTEAGERYYQKSRLIVEEMEELNAEIAHSKGTLTGNLKIAVPLSFGLHHLTPALKEFCQRHPELKLDLEFSDKKINLVEDGIDLAIRIGELTDSSLKAKLITNIEHVLCASPDYLAQHGTPVAPEDIQHHQFLKYSQTPLSGITLTDADNHSHLAPITPHLVANNGDFLKDMATAGHGIVFLPRFIVWKELQSEALTPILTNYSLNKVGAYVVYPSTRFLPRKSRLFIDFLASYYGSVPYWDRTLS